MYRIARGRARLALALTRRHSLSLLLWVAAVLLLSYATAMGVEQLRAWAVLLALLATTAAVADMSRHIINRLTQIIGYFHDNVSHDSSRTSHDTGTVRPIRRIR
jgi:hypothetical protein